MICGDEFATYLPPRFSVTEQAKADRKSIKRVYKVATNLKKQTDGSKKSSKATHYYLDTKQHNIMTTLGCWPQSWGFLQDGYG